MNQPARDIFRRIESWPPEDQEELAEHAREIEARRGGVYRLSEDEQAALAGSAAEARAGRFATEGEIAAIFKKARAPRA